MREVFQRDLSIPGNPEALWERLLDVPTVASWISIVEDVREIEPLQQFAAVLRDRMGPFKLRADLSIEVLKIEGESIRIRAAGEDRQIRSRIRVEATLNIKRAAQSAFVGVEGEYEVTGRVATLGAGSIRKKAALILDEFFDHLGREFCTDTGSPHQGVNPA